MAIHVALLRAVNVGGAGALPMKALRDLCEASGFRGVRTYIASGNVVFDADGDAAQVKALLESRLQAHIGKPVSVVVRSEGELAAALESNPFQACAPNLVHIVFLDGPAPEDPLTGAAGQSNEEITAGRREIYIHYPQGQGASKLKLPVAKLGTARNINTVAKLVEMARA